MNKTFTTEQKIAWHKQRLEILQGKSEQQQDWNSTTEIQTLQGRVSVLENLLKIALNDINHMRRTLRIDE